MRTRYWGLYNWCQNLWLHAPGVGGKRLRYTEPESAGDAAQTACYGRHIGPRPFYVIRKPRNLPPEAQAVIDECRAYIKQQDSNAPAYTQGMRMALAAYEATK